MDVFPDCWFVFCLPANCVPATARTAAAHCSAHCMRTPRGARPTHSTTPGCCSSACHSQRLVCNVSMNCRVLQWCAMCSVWLCSASAAWTADCSSVPSSAGQKCDSKWKFCWELCTQTRSFRRAAQTAQTKSEVLQHPITFLCALL